MATLLCERTFNPKDPEDHKWLRMLINMQVPLEYFEEGIWYPSRAQKHGIKAITRDFTYRMKPLP